MKSLRQSVSGFNLVEMMVVLSVIGVLAAFALSSFTSLSQSQQAKNASFELYSSLSLARSEAIKRNSNVTVTPLVAGDWGQGWAITATTPVAETIRSQAALKKVAITLGPASVVYARTGRPAATGVFQIDTAPVNTAVRRCINITLSGMPRITKTTGACPP